MDAHWFESSLLQSRKGSSFVVALPKGHKRMMGRSLPGLLQQFVGHPVSIDLVESSEEQLYDSIASRKKRKQAERRRAIEQEMISHPMVQKSLDLFKGTIRSVEVEEPEDEE
jgi:hypothetical protein